jgi:carboxypeptidase Q
MSLFKIFVPVFLTGVCLAQKEDSVMLRRIYTEALTHGQCYANLDYLSNKIGGRLSGSPQAQKAVEWANAAMIRAGSDRVFQQECMVPHWVRGSKEQAQIRKGNKPDEIESVNICALGGSIGTPANGILAAVVEVKSVEELYTLGIEKIKGKIVFFNRPFDNSIIDPFVAYGKAVDQRWKGPSIAAKFGAVATICRSMTTGINDIPHAGSMEYLDSIPRKIPACAISTVSAERLSELLKSEGADVEFYMKMDCKTLPDEKSFNVIAEIKGSVAPEKIIVVGGHLDSWETGDGAQDDGAGVVQCIEVIRILKALGVKPACTIRAVAFMNEENGLRGGNKYAELARQNKEQHILAIETDRGGFTPRGFTFTGTAEKRNQLLKWKPLFEPYGVYDFSGEGGGADVSPLGKAGVPVMELYPDPQRYFDYHHTSNDTFKSVNERELEMGAASLAALVYLVSKHGL